MSVIAEGLAAARQPVKPKFEQWLELLDVDDHDALVNAATDASLTNAAILRVVVDAGCAVNKDTISAWRRSHGFRR